MIIFAHPRAQGRLPCGAGIAFHFTGATSKMTIRTTLAAALMLAIGCGAANAEFKDITVDGQTITKSSQTRLAHEALMAGGDPHAAVKPGFEDDIRQLVIERTVLANAARRQGLDKKADVREEIRDQGDTILARHAVTAYADAHPVSEADAKAEYGKRKAKYGDTEVQLDHILVATKEEAAKIIAELKKGGDFGKLAAEKSLDRMSAENGGELPWTSPNSFTPDLAKAVKGLKKGELCKEPVASPAGFHVVKLADTRAAKFPSYDDMQVEITRDLLQERIRAWVNEEIAKAKVVK
jgi:peptidyl-prolyl cis-trans isomerase C